jgi:O-antigen/teichoic acid export membrane protein
MNIHTNNYIKLLTSSVFVTILNVAVISLSTRVLGPVGMGKWTILSAAATFLQTAFLNWQRGPLVRFGREEWLCSGSIQNTMGARYPLIVAGTVLGLLVVTLQPYGWFDTVLKLPPGSWLVVFLLLLGFIVRDETATLLKVVYDISLMSIMSVASSAALLIVYLYLFFTKTDPALFSRFVIGMIILPFVVWGWLWIRLLLTTNVRLCLPERTAMRANFNYSWPLIPTFIVGYLSDWGDHILIQMYYSSHEVGLFAAAYKVILPITSLATPLTTLLVPLIVGKSIKDPKTINTFIQKAIPSLSSLWILIILPIVTVLPYLFVIIVGNQFSDALPIVYVLALLLPGTIMTALFSAIYSQQGRLLRLSIYTTFRYHGMRHWHLRIIPFHPICLYYRSACVP